MKFTVIQRITIGFTSLIVFLIVISYSGVVGVEGIRSNLDKITTQALPISNDADKLATQFSAVNLAMYQHYNSSSVDKLDESERVFKDVEESFLPVLDRLQNHLEGIKDTEQERERVNRLKEKVPEVLSSIKSTMRAYRLSFNDEATLGRLSVQVEELEVESKDVIKRVRSVQITGADKRKIEDTALHVSQGVSLIKLISAATDNKSFRQYIGDYTKWMTDYLEFSYRMQEIAGRRGGAVSNALNEQNRLVSRIINLVGNLTGYGNTKELYLGTKETLVNNLEDNEQSLKEIKDELDKLNGFASQYSKIVSDKTSESAHDKKKTIVLISIVAVLVGGVIAVFLVTTIRSGLHTMMTTLQRMATGDLTEDLSRYSDDEFGKLRASAFTLSNYLRDMIDAIKSQSHLILHSIEQTQSVTGETKSAISGQKAEIDMVATAMQEMTATIREVSHIAQDTLSQMVQAHDNANHGKEHIQENQDLTLDLKEDMDTASNVIKQLDNDVRKIEEILQVIDSIAQQTNLLALNAAIEAARAGEHGRGFSVVADEVRTLASRTQESTEEIKHNIDTLLASSMQAVGSINRSQERTGQSVLKAQAIKEQIERIVEIMTRTKDMNMQIATASEEQSAVTEEVTKNITRILDLAESTEKGAEKNEMSMSELVDSSMTLENIVEKFKLD